MFYLASDDQVICPPPHICLQTLLQRLVRRLTRFFTTVNADASLSALKSVCDCLALNYKLSCSKLVHLHLGKVNRDQNRSTLTRSFNFPPSGDGEHPGQTQQ